MRIVGDWKHFFENPDKKHATWAKAGGKFTARQPNISGGTKFRAGLPKKELIEMLEKKSYEKKELKKYGDKIFSQIRNVGKDVISGIEDYLSKNESPDDELANENILPNTTTFHYFMKAYRTAKSIEILWKSNKSEDCAILLRTIVEAYFELDYFVISPTENEKKFNSFEKAKMDNDLLGITNALDHSSNKEFSKLLTNFPEGILPVAQTYKEIKKVGFQNSWHDMSIAQISKSGRNKDNFYYYTIDYTMLSDQVHSTTFSNTNIFKDKNSNLTKFVEDAYPFDMYISKKTFEYLVLIAKIVSEFNKLDLKFTKYEDVVKNIDLNQPWPRWHHFERLNQ